MRPLRLRLLHRSSPLARVAQNASHRWTHRDSLLVRVEDGAGRIGWGECAPLDGHSLDTLPDCARALGAVAALPALDDSLPPQEALGAALDPLGGALALLPAARFALECALLDLLGQQRALPLARLLRDAPRAVVPLNGLCDDLSDPEALCARASSLVARGFRTLKLKVGSPLGLARELGALQALREALPLVALRLDANGAWTPAQARSALQQLAPLGLDFVEQPVPPGQLASLGACAVPWAADESLRDPDEAEALLRAPGCVAVVLKPALLGMRRALDLAQRATARGLGALVTHLLDGPVGLAAARGLSLALPGPVLACGLAAHAGLSAWPEVTHPPEEAALHLSAAPGLGLSLSAREALDALFL